MSEVAFKKFSTFTTAATGSMTRKYTTASTVAGTLSRVMTSCLATSMVTTRRSIFTMRSTIGIRKMRPGPFGAEQFAEAEDDAALVFAQDADRLRQDDGGQDDQMATSHGTRLIRV